MACKLRLAFCNYCKHLMRSRRIFKFNTRFNSSITNISKQQIDLANFTPDRIRNFGIIAHVDHGKSTLADRLLEGAIVKSQNNKQVLDKLQVERERGITVKAQTASIVYNCNSTDYLLNLIDTPGHVDFTYEVSRSLSACQGVILVVDATQGIQAQTLANFYLTLEHELKVIPVINKIDLATADVSRVTEEMQQLLDISADDIISISAKHGTNIDLVLKAVVERLPSPDQTHHKPCDRNGLLKALLFDSQFERFRGVVANLLILEGKVSKGDMITSHSLQQKTDKSKKVYEVKEVGVLRPENEPTGTLYAGQVGYIVCGMKNTAEALIGDTLYHYKYPVIPLPGFKKSKPVVFGGMFPTDQSEYKSLEVALNRLTLNDRSVTIEKTSSAVLGQGFRVGFLGLLHMDVFQQRLEQEFSTSAILTSPNVLYKAFLKPNKKKSIKASTEVLIRTASQFPQKSDVEVYLQPMILATIITPAMYDVAVLNLCMEKSGIQVSNNYISDTRVMFQFRMPLSEIMVDFYDSLKSITSGYASFDYEDAGYEIVDLVKLTFLLNGEVVDELSSICPEHKARKVGAKMCARLCQLIPKELYAIPVQAAIGKTIIARETIPAIKKDVLAKCSGGDYTRKMKLLRQHSKHQKKLKELNSVRLPKNIFIDVLK